MFGLSIDGQKYFEIHHTAKDVFEAVHPREMELGTASMASLVYLIDKYGHRLEFFNISFDGM